jgi:hypothetical protein
MKASYTTSLYLFYQRRIFGVSLAIQIVIESDCVQRFSARDIRREVKVLLQQLIAYPFESSERRSDTGLNRITCL